MEEEAFGSCPPPFAFYMAGELVIDFLGEDFET
jgi:hypothetical protein